MVPWLQSLLELVVGGTVGIFAKYLMDSLKEWRQGKKNEAQKMLQRVEIHKTRADRITNEYNYLRAWILAQGLDGQQLKDLPPPPPDD